ncbi:hypothetical protein [Shinella zoogloeoides]|uniref:hypothetical protein n=1 Tax=Shinella zoogloeoides TaxID=352475 RepID=UPI00299D6BB5|nr:hypothetical protein [Shinella zoogloeoides]WPE22505.1 hypothetical protein ShzoTeo12_37210 [Shinella zoogloeoides]
MDRRTFIRGAVIAASTPAAIGAVSTLGIGVLVNRYRAANAAWLATAGADGDVEAEGPEYEAAWSAVKDVVTHQCQTAEEVQEKIKAVLSDQWLCETAECGWDVEAGRLHRHFLRSLII